MCSSGDLFIVALLFYVGYVLNCREKVVLKAFLLAILLKKMGVPSAESSRSVQGLGKGVSGKPYPRLCNARRPRLKPGTFRSQAVRLYRLTIKRTILHFR